MAITVRGKKLNPREQRAQVTAWGKLIYGEDWSYEKAYDRLRFQARAYERGTMGERVNVPDLLANEIRRQIIPTAAGDIAATTPSRTSSALYQAVTSAPVVNTTRQLTQANLEALEDAEYKRYEKSYRGWLSQKEFRKALEIRQGVGLTQLKRKMTPEQYGAALQAAKDKVWLESAGTLGREELKEWRKRAFKSP